MSLYDKYHSKHNKNHMYNLITDIIHKEYSDTRVKTNDTFNQFFETNFKNTFQSVMSEELSDFNQHLLDTQLNYYRDFISKTYTKEEPNQSDSTDSLESTDVYVIHSFQRNINLVNSTRHNYRIHNPMKGKSCSIDKVIVPIEETSLFMTPILLVSLDTKTLELHLRGTMKMNHREYGIYSPFLDKEFMTQSDILRIQLKNQLGFVDKRCDVYKITSTDKQTVSVTCTPSEFIVGDYIRICNFESLEITDETVLTKSYQITEIKEHSNQLYLTLNQEIPSCTGLYAMNMSLQNTFSFH